MKESTLEVSENLCKCLECRKWFDCETDIQLCEKCMDKFDVDRLWELHDLRELDALDFNESEEIRERFRLVGAKNNRRE